MSPKVSNEYKHNKKLELLEAAKNIFIKKGYTMATMRDIMDEANVSRGALYSYFSNIDNAFMEVLKFDDQSVLDFFEPNEDDFLWVQLVNWIHKKRLNIQIINQSLLFARAEFFLSSNYIRDKERYSYVRQRYLNLIESIKMFIQSGIAKGEFHPQLPIESIALYFISFLDGLMLNTFQLTSEVTNVDAQIEVFLFTLEKMLCPIK